MSQQINFNQLSSNTPFVSSVFSRVYRYAKIGLSLVTPGMLWITHLSLQSTYRFSEARYWLFHPVGKVFVVVSTTLCFYHSLVSLYSSMVSTYALSSRYSKIIILLSTIAFTAGFGYWFW